MESHSADAGDARHHGGNPSPLSAASLPPPITTVHEALVAQLVRPHTDYLVSFRSSQEMTLSDLQHVTHAIAATSAKMDQADATFSKLPLYISKLATMQRNLSILRDNSAKTNTLAKAVASQLGMAEFTAPPAGRQAK
jgi:hypothetical protein